MKFRLVDKIVACTPGRCIAGRKAVSFEEYSLRQPLQAEAALPESLALGAVFELASWLLILSSDFTELALPQQIDSATFHRPLRPGERLELSVELLRRQGDCCTFSGRATIAGAPSLEIAAWQAQGSPLGGFYDPADLRTLYSEIGAPL